MEPRNRFQGMNSASLCSLAGRHDNPIPTRFLSPLECLKIPTPNYALEVGLNRRYKLRLHLSFLADHVKPCVQTEQTEEGQSYL
jgi:hypothetical protein